jgi:hypothetical protein
MKKIVIALVIGLTGMSSTAYAGNDISWVPNSQDYSKPTAHSFVFPDRLALPWLFSVLQSYNNPNSVVCSSTGDSACSSNGNFGYNSILKVCVSTTDLDCISRVDSIDPSGTTSSGVFSKYTVKDHLNSYPADPVVGIPEGSVPGIWKIPSAPHASGDEYAVVAGLNGIVNRGGGSWHPSEVGSVLQLSLMPVALKDFGKGHASIAGGWNQSIKDVYYDYCATAALSPTRTGADCAHVNGDACILPTNDQGMCYAEEDFGAIQKFNVQLRLSQEPTGWMHGRMTDPAISISKLSSGGVNLSVTAGTTNVPMVFATGDWASLPSNVQNAGVQCASNLNLCGTWAAKYLGADSSWIDKSQSLVGNANIALTWFVNSSGPLPLSIMSAISPLTGNKSTALTNTWSMRTLTNTEMSGANKCFTNTPGLKGIVTTNSTAYSAGPPEFKDGSLNYQVSSPHFNPDGTTPFKGNYNLVMRSDVARCIYGFTKAPIKASISVLSSEGSNDVATTIANEKDGWLYLTANNFQFSSPIIQVKLSQDAPAVATPAKSTITCVKGKTTKTVTGVKPVCPTGYKKK